VWRVKVVPRLGLDEKTREGLRRGRLDPVPVEPCFARAASYRRLAPAGQRDEQNIIPLGKSAQATRHLTAIHPRHSEVEHYDLGRPIGDALQGRRTVVCDLDVGTQARQQHRGAVGSVAVVVDHENAHKGRKIAFAKLSPLKRVLKTALALSQLNSGHGSLSRFHHEKACRQ
jgi:hypothetical protein